MNYKLKTQSVILLSAIMVCLSLFAASTTADEKTQKEKDLQALNKKITQLKQVIDVKKDTRSRYQTQLRKLELNIGAINRKIKSTTEKIDRNKAELNALGRSRRQHQEQLIDENDALSKQVYSAFVLGRQERIKFLFSQQDAEVLQRNIMYYQYFTDDRVDLINKVQSNIETILQTEAEISRSKQTLDAHYQLLSSQKASLKEDSRKRQTIIASLNKQLKTQGGHLHKLEDDARELHNLIKSIEQILVATPEPMLENKPFASLKGKLAWPVKGKVKKLFDRQKPLSNLRWQGIMIEAPAGSHVKSISSGRVAFADWLRGMGNLIIIDHGNSYLSLYGHNESLFKSAGDLVQAGDIISSIGSSGGQNSSALYFEIRRKGKPQNPTKWCKKGNSFAS